MRCHGSRERLDQVRQRMRRAFDQAHRIPFGLQHLHLHQSLLLPVAVWDGVAFLSARATRRFHPRQLAHLLLGLRQVPWHPVPMPILKSDSTLAVVDATDNMLFLFPHCSPDRHIIKATVSDPGDRLVRFERFEGWLTVSKASWTSADWLDIRQGLGY